MPKSTRSYSLIRFPQTRIPPFSVKVCSYRSSVGRKAYQGKNFLSLTQCSRQPLCSLSAESNAALSASRHRPSAAGAMLLQPRAVPSYYCRTAAAISPPDHYYTVSWPAGGGTGAAVVVGWQECQGNWVMARRGIVVAAWRGTLGLVRCAA